jgi:hypothetical protein
VQAGMHDIHVDGYWDEGEVTFSVFVTIGNG